MITLKPLKFRVLSALLVGAVLLAAQNASAQARTWTNSTNDSKWSTAANWTGGALSATSTVLFDAITPAARSNSTVDQSISVASLTFTQNSATPHTLTVGAGQTLTLSGAADGTDIFRLGAASGNTQVVITGATGALNVVGATSGGVRNSDFSLFHSSGTSSTVGLDMSGLGTFTANVRNFMVGTHNSGATSSSTSRFKISFAQNNTITANVMRFGGVGGTGGSGSDGNAGSTDANANRVTLGQSNTFNSNTIVFGSGRTGVRVGWGAGTASTRNFNIRATDGIGRADLIFGNKSGSHSGVDAGSTSIVVSGDFRGGNVDWLLDELILSQNSTTDANNGVGYARVDMSFDAGTIDATTVVIGKMMNSNTEQNLPMQIPNSWPGEFRNVTHGTLNMGGGVLKAGTLTLGQNEDGSAGVNGMIWGLLNVTGGTVDVAGDFTMGTHTALAPSDGYAKATATFTGAGTSIKIGGNLTEGVRGDNQSALTLDGITLDMTDGYINVDSLTITGGVISNLNEIFSGAPDAVSQGLAVALNKTGTNTLTLDGRISTTGGINMQGGDLHVGRGTAGGGLGYGAVNLAASTVLQFNRTGVFSEHAAINGNNINIRHIGSGHTTLRSAGTLRNATVDITSGRLIFHGLSPLSSVTGERANINVAAGAGFGYTSGGASQTLNVNNLTYNRGGTSTLTLGVGDTLAIGNMTWAGSGTATIQVLVHIDPSFSLTANTTYTLATAPGNLTGSGITYEAKFYNLTNALFTAAGTGLQTAAGNITLTTGTVNATPPATLYWRGGVYDNEWAASSGGAASATASNWSINQGGTRLGVVPGKTTAVIFSGDAGTSHTTSLGADMWIKSLSVTRNQSSQAQQVVVNDPGRKLTIEEGITVGAQSSLTLNNDVHFNSVTSPNILVGAQQGGTGVELSAEMIISGAISGNGFTKVGAGNLTLSGGANNIYTGITTVSMGTLFLGKIDERDAISGSELRVISNTTDTNALVTLNGTEQINDSVRLVLGHRAIFSLNGNSETIAAIDDGDPVLGTNVVSRIRNQGTAAGTLTVGAGGASGRFTGIIENGTGGTLSIVKIGSGEQIFGGEAQNTYTGTTTVRGGRLTYAGSNVIGTGAVVLDGGALSGDGSGAILNMNGYSDTVGGLTLLDGQILGEGSVLNTTGNNVSNGIIYVAIAGSGAMTKSGTGVVELHGNNTYSGATAVNAGTLRLFHNNALGTTAGATTVNSTLGILELTGGITITGEALTLSGRVGAYAENSALRSVGDNVWTGGITGAINTSVQNQSAFNLETNSGLLNITGNFTVSGTAQTSAALNFRGDGNGLFSGNIGNGTLTGGLNLFFRGTGEWTLAGTGSTYTGTTNVLAGSLVAKHQGALGSTSNLLVSSGAGFRYQRGVQGQNLTLAAMTLSGGSRLGVELGNTISVTGAATTSGNITVDVYGIPNFAYSNKIYDVVTAASGLGGTTNYQLGYSYNATNYKVTNFGWNDTTIWVEATGVAEIATAYWKGGFGNGLGGVWSVSGGGKSNWVDENGNDSPVVPGANSNVVFSAAAAQNQGSMVLGADMSVGTLTFRDSQAVSLVDGTYGITLNGANAITVESTAGTVSLDAQISFGNANAIVDVANGKNLTLGTLRGSNAFTKTGLGTLTLGGLHNNTYTGDVRIKEGLALLQKQAGLNTIVGNLFIGSDVDHTTATVRLMSANTIANESIVNISQGSILDLNGNSDTIGGLNGAGNVISSAGSFAHTLTVGAGNNSSVLQGSIRQQPGAAALSFAKTGTGTFELQGDSHFTGTLNVSGGTLRLSGNNTGIGNVSLTGTRNAPATLVIAHSNALGTGNKTVTNNATDVWTNSIHIDGSMGDVNLAAGINFQTSTSNGYNTNGSSYAAIRNVAGTNSIGGNITLTSGAGASVLVSEAGRITFTGTIASNTSNRELYLRGNGDGEITGNINGSGGNAMAVILDQGTGTWVFRGDNAYSNETRVNSGTLRIANALSIKNSNHLNVGANGNFQFVTGTTADQVLTLAGAGLEPTSINALTLANGATLGMELGKTIALKVDAKATTAGTVKMDLFGHNAVTARRYNLLTASTASIHTAAYSLGNVYNNTNFRVTGGIQKEVAGSTYSVYVNTVAADTLSVAYWKGGFAGGSSIWAVSNGDNLSNWTKNEAGTEQTGVVPGATTDVFFSGTTATTGTTQNMTLGANVVVGSLTFQANSPAVNVKDNTNDLTITKANAITVAAGSGNVTLDTKVNLTSATIPVVSVNGANTVLTLNQQITTQQGLQKVGSGTTVVRGTQTYTGRTNVVNGSYMVNGTHTGAGVYTVSNGARLGGTGRIVAAANASVSIQQGGRLSIGDSTAALPSASVFSITTSGDFGSLDFENGSFVDFDIFSGGGHGSAWSAEDADQLAINGNLVTDGTVSLTLSSSLALEQLNTWRMGDTWKLIDWGVATGPGGNSVFTLIDQINVAQLGLSWSTENLMSSGTIMLVPEPGRAILLLIGAGFLFLRRRR